jgi:hypothetical protein
MMNSMKFSIQTLQNQKPGYHTLFVHPNAARQLHLPSGALHLAFGSNVLTVHVLPHTSATHQLLVAKTTANALMLPDGIELYGTYLKKRRLLKLAPLIGIMVSEKEVSENASDKFGPLTSFCQEISRAGRSKAALVYIFSIDQYKSEHASIEGWVLKNNQWSRQRFPLPDIIYNRLTSRSHESRPEVQAKIYHLKRTLNSFLFNERFLDKWEVYQTLRESPEMLHLLPETQLVRNESDLKDMIKRYTPVFAKPKAGSLGQGIIRIEKLGPSQYHVTFIRRNQQNSTSYTSFKQLSQSLMPRMKKYTYIVQQGIPLVTIDNRPVDFRVLVQKKAPNAWSVTSIVARIANDKSIVSNLAQGGTLVTVSQAFKGIKWRTSHPPEPSHLIKTALKVTQTLEKQIEGHFAEFGIDLAADAAGNIWLLEVNSKPSKTENAALNGSEHVRPSVHKTINYMLALMNLNNEKKGKKTAVNRLKKKR